VSADPGAEHVNRRQFAHGARAVDHVTEHREHDVLGPEDANDGPLRSWRPAARDVSKIEVKVRVSSGPIGVPDEVIDAAGHAEDDGVARGGKLEAVADVSAVAGDDPDELKIAHPSRAELGAGRIVDQPGGVKFGNRRVHGSQILAIRRRKAKSPGGAFRGGGQSSLGAITGSASISFS
jgi:hypothetical protein